MNKRAEKAVKEIGEFVWGPQGKEGIVAIIMGKSLIQQLIDRQIAMIAPSLRRKVAATLATPENLQFAGIPVKKGEKWDYSYLFEREPFHVKQSGESPAEPGAR